jgi:hypothetical protein
MTDPSTTPTVQYRVFVAKGNELVEGPDDADIVVTVPVEDVRDATFDPTVSYMRGRLKTTGSTGQFFQLLRAGTVGEALSRLASPS